jgi:hypothetical protein
MRPRLALLLAIGLLIGGCGSSLHPVSRPGASTVPSRDVSLSTTYLIEQARALHGAQHCDSSDQAVVLLEVHIQRVANDAIALFTLGEIHPERGVRYTLGPPAFATAADVAHRLSPLDAARGYELLGRTYMWRG